MERNSFAYPPAFESLVSLSYDFSPARFLCSFCENSVKSRHLKVHIQKYFRSKLDQNVAYEHNVKKNYVSSVCIAFKLVA